VSAARIHSRRPPALRLIAGLALLLAGQARAEVLEARVDTARDYGHVLGDVIHGTLDIPDVAGHEFDADSLPKPGALNRWLELRRVWLEPRGGQPPRIHLEYQVFYVPLTVKTLTIPAMTLQRKTPDSGRQPIEVRSWPITVAPIHGPAVMAEGGMRLMQPDAPPVLPDSRGLVTGVALSLALALVSLAYLGHVNGYLSIGRRGRHFRAACKGVRALMRQNRSQETLRAGFLLMHRAFERTLGKPLFAEDLPRFYQQHPDYQALRADIEAWFEASYRQFFGADASPEDFTLERLHALCCACLRLERQRS
jgi:mxaA protein